MKKTVGLVADNMTMLHRLHSILTTIHCDVKCSFTAAQIQHIAPVDLNIWLVVSESADEVFELLSEWSESQIFLADDMPSILDEFAYQQWRYRLAEKLSKVVESKALLDESHSPPVILSDHERYDDVWVLAASLGGPEAVKVFLSHLDPALPISFIYAQHIEESFAQWLPDILNKDSRFDVRYGEHGMILKRGTVTVLPSHRLTNIDDGGVLHVAETLSWKAPYTPNLDQVIQNVAKKFHNNMGVIVFSGMCDDGAQASISLSKRGVPIWAQEPEECICSSMPDSVIQEQCVSYIGSAKSLAQHLNKRYMKL